MSEHFYDFNFLLGLGMIDSDPLHSHSVGRAHWGDKVQDWIGRFDEATACIISIIQCELACVQPYIICIKQCASRVAHSPPGPAQDWI